MSKTITFKHSGFAGDIIYSLPAIKQICKNMDCKAILYVFIDRTWEDFEDVGRTHRGLITAEGVEFLRPLLNSLEFISDVRIWKGEQIAVDLDRVKHMGQQIGLPHSHISRWYGYAYPELSTDALHERVIDLADIEAYMAEQNGGIADLSFLENKILVNRTARNTNPYINYVFLQSYPVLFTGSLDEYNRFLEQVPTAKYYRTENSDTLARAIGRCKFFIGNQSMCYAIAEQMKTPRLLEACSYATNVVPIGKNGYDFFTQQGFEYLVEKLWNK